MGVKRFKTLIAIAEQGTFAKAAASLYLTPAAVSQQMKVLEEELNLSLFDRNKRPPELSSSAHALIPKAKELVRVYDDLVYSSSVETLSHENLDIGSVPTTMAGIMPQALSALQDSHDQLHTRIYPGQSEDLLTQVDRGFLDVALLTEPPTVYSHLLWQPLIEEPLVVLAPKDTASDDPREILQTYPFIRFARKAWVGKLIENWLLENHIKVHEKMEIETLESATAMVRNNLGVSIIPWNCCSSVQYHDIKAIPLGDSAKPRVLGVLRRRDSQKHQLIDILFTKLNNIVKAN